MTHNNKVNNERSVLASLRSLIPERPAEFEESLIIAELQANRFLLRTNTAEAPMPAGLVEQMPRIKVMHRPLPMSGLSFWDARAQSWVIMLNSREPLTRRRFTLLHEYKHIIDHGRTDLLYTGNGRYGADKQAEIAADYFAGCALMSKRLVKRAWGAGMQTSQALAAHFDVSVPAVDVRLAQLGLRTRSERCVSGPQVQQLRSWRPRTYYRQQTGRLQLPTIPSLRLATELHHA